MFKRFAPLVCAALLAALLFSLSAAAAPAEPQLYYPTGGVSEWVFSEVPAVGAAPQVSLLDGQTAEAVILQGLQEKEQTIDISSFHLTSEEASSIYMEVVFSHPELFYVKTGARIGIVNGYSSAIMPYYIDELLSPEAQAAFNARVDKILAETIAPDMSRVEMALSLHDYLVLHCAYDWNVANGKGASSDNVYTAYDALMKGNAVCQGYAMAYNLLLNKVGMETDYVTSVIPNQGSHGWSLVKIGETWYHVDVTWDDPLTILSGFNHDLPGRCDHAYFLVSTKTMEPEHGSFTVTQKTDTTYESGYVFCGAKVPFFWMAEAFYYIGANNSLQSATDLQTGPAASSYPVLAQRYGSTLFARDYSYNTTYGYDMVTEQRYSLTDIPSGSGYGLQEYDDGVYLVEIPDGPGVTKGSKLRLPLDGSLHCNNPAVSSSAVTVSIQNGQTQKRIVSLCLAAYDKAGQLLSLSWEDVLVASGESKDAAFALPQGSEAKVFYLDEARRPLRATAAVLP